MKEEGRDGDGELGMTIDIYVFVGENIQTFFLPNGCFGLGYIMLTNFRRVWV